jgi:hypothetical protein
MIFFEVMGKHESLIPNVDFLTFLDPAIAIQN